MTVIFALLALAAAPPEREFGDWAVACDNVKRCISVSLQARTDDHPVPMVITRDPGPAGALVIEIAPEGPEGRVTLSIDGKPVAPAVMLETGIRLTGSAAEGLARAMAVGRKLQIRDYRGKRVATISLLGSSATLRLIDAEQGRAGGITALVARGTKPASAVPAARPLPGVPAVRAPKGPVPRIAPALIEALAKSGECALESNENAPKPEIWRLDARSTLVLIPCGSGAYNFNSAAFVVAGGKGVPARFDVGPQGISDDSPILTNAAWDPKLSQLRHYAKARGLGDCGTSQEWVWDGSRFRLIRAAELSECRGAIDWPVTFRATPVWR